jgi:hypothetical protein
MFVVIRSRYGLDRERSLAQTAPSQVMIESAEDAIAQAARRVEAICAIAGPYCTATGQKKKFWEERRMSTRNIMIIAIAIIVVIGGIYFYSANEAAEEATPASTTSETGTAPAEPPPADTTYGQPN